MGRETIGHDAVAGLVLGVESVPDGLASGLLAGVNPVAGLYAYLFGTIGGATLTNTPFMAVQATGAMALLVADVDLATRPDPARALFTLSVLTGIVMLAAGFLKAGSLLRFVPTAVMVGLISAVGVNIVLGQLSNLTGYDAHGANRMTRTFDLVVHPGRIEGWSVLVGVVTIVPIVVLERTPLRSLGLVVAVAVGSVVAALLGNAAHPVPLVEDLASVPGSLPSISWPAFGDIGFLAAPAISLAFVGLVQGASVSAALPRPDDSANPSRDFLGQGLGNELAGLFQGMPVGGSMSASALVVAGGARTRVGVVVRPVA
ncbi:MAG: SulP family inorganic anion transporter [Actinomycetota bacterium]